MNIFAISNDPFECAGALDDRRVVKMTTETAQMLSDAIARHNGIPFYKKCNPNHPCTKWVGDTLENFKWTMALLKELNDEYRYRYNKNHDHLAFSKAYEVCNNQLSIFPEKELTTFANCSLFKDEPDVKIAYRKTMIEKWTNFKMPPRWTRTDPPGWANI